MEKETYQNTPWVHSPFFEEIISKDNVSPQLIEFAKKYNKDGYVIVENLLSAAECDKVISQTDTLFDQSKKDGAISYYRYQDAWQKSPAVKALASNPKILETIKYLYNRNGFPFQTLNFKFGSQQNAHSDCIHFSCIPSRFMCGVWVALEDIDSENGPLFYYPGSQVLEECNLYDLGLGVDNLNYVAYEEYQNQLMKSLHFEKHELHIKKGSALIWASNLVHGGTAIKDTARTRY